MICILKICFLLHLGGDPHPNIVIFRVTSKHHVIYKASHIPKSDIRANISQNHDVWVGIPTHSTPFRAQMHRNRSSSENSWYTFKKSYRDYADTSFLRF